MDDLLRQIQEAVRAERVEVADHAYDQMLDRLIDPEDAIMGTLKGRVIEDYRQTRQEERALILQTEQSGQPLHTVWDLPLADGDPIVLVTAYRPDPEAWNHDFTERTR